MRRFFTEPENISDGKAKLIEDAAHITRVLRMNAGDEILIFDGSGKEYTARLITLNADGCTAEIISSAQSAQEPNIKVTIYQGLPKSGKMEGIVQKSVELGAYAVVPVAMDRCVSKLDGGKKEAEKLKRWNKVAVEAAKQCGRGILPKVEPCISFSAAVEKLKAAELAIMPYELLGHMGDSGLKAVLQKNSGAAEIGIIIGPEGGFSDKEAQLAKESGISLVGLGRRILRTETVSAAMLASVMYEYDE